MTINATEYQYAFALKKQTDLTTALADEDMTLCLPMDGFAPIKAEYPEKLSDGAMYGKGHDWATYCTRLTERYPIPTRAFPLSPRSACFAPYLVLGNLVSSTVSTGIYDHTMTFQAKATGSVKLTTIVEKAGAEYTQKVTGVAVSSFTVDFERKNYTKISWDGVGRASTSFAGSMPAVTSEACFFKTLSGTFKFGTSGGASTDVSTETLSGSITVSQNPALEPMPGGSGLISKAMIGKQTISGNIKLYFDQDYRAFFTADTECELQIVLLGDLISGSYYHTVTIDIKHFKIASADITQEGDQVACQINFDENTVLKGTTDEYFQWKVRTNFELTGFTA